jgi:hypothetical protein
MIWKYCSDKKWSWNFMEDMTHQLRDPSLPSSSWPPLNHKAPLPLSRQLSQPPTQSPTPLLPPYSLSPAATRANLKYDLPSQSTWHTELCTDYFRRASKMKTCPGSSGHWEGPTWLTGDWRSWRSWRSPCIEVDSECLECKAEEWATQSGFGATRSSHCLQFSWKLRANTVKMKTGGVDTGWICVQDTLAKGQGWMSCGEPRGISEESGLCPCIRIWGKSETSTGLSTARDTGWTSARWDQLNFPRVWISREKKSRFFLCPSAMRKENKECNGDKVEGL